MTGVYREENMNEQNVAFLPKVLERLRANQTEQYGYFVRTLYASVRIFLNARNIVHTYVLRSHSPKFTLWQDKTLTVKLIPVMRILFNWQLEKQSLTAEV